ncbi:MAG: hypothetical protein ACRDIX_10970 [Actinomycetota bacterium]
MSVTRERAAGEASTPPDRASRAWRALAPVAGPLLILASVLFMLRDFAFGGMVSAQHVDPLAIWLPLHCFLGTSLAAGHVPAWNPYTMGGVPFAADPQSGWMSLPVMALYSALPCDVAIRWFVVLQPMIGGLAIYWFLREEGVSQIGATVGGLLLAMAVATSRTALALPFAGTLAWSAVLLACGSRYLSAAAWPNRMGWAAATALAWGQLAAAHMSHGLIIGTGILLAYGVARVTGEIRAGRRTAGDALVQAGLLVVALPLVNLAFFLPRLMYLPRTSLAQGYQRLADLSALLAGRPAGLLRPGFSATWPWPFTLSTSTGVYLGAAALALSFAGAWARRFRRLTVALGVYAGLCYVLSLKGFAEFVAPAVRAVPFGDFYLHEPSRFRYGVLLALVVAIPLGVEAWRERRTPRERAFMLMPGVALWWLGPVLVGAYASRLLLLGVGAVLGGLALLAMSRRPAVAWALPGVLALELVANGLLGQAHSTEFVENGIVPAKERVPFTPLLRPNIEADAYVRAGPLVRELQAAGAVRYLSLDPSRSGTRGHLLSQTESDWGLMANHRSVLFRAEEAQGYNPVQSIRYWLFVRAAEPKRLRYNAAVFIHPTGAVLDLLQVGLVVGPSAYPPLPGLEPVTNEGEWTLYRFPRHILESSAGGADIEIGGPAPRASLITAWEVVRPGEALGIVTGPGFDPSTRAVLEESPGMEPPGEAPGHATYRQEGPQAAEVIVDGRSPALLVVRNVWDPGWRATIDGRPAPVLVADYLLQGIPVPAGRHTVELRYDDPWVGFGVLGSALALGALAAAAFALRRRPVQTPGR